MTEKQENFIITQAQRQAVFNALVQYPAKEVLAAIDILRTLSPVGSPAATNE